MSLCTLPPDLILMITDCFDLTRDINSLARTTRRLHALLNPYIYRRNVRNHGASALTWAVLSTSLSTLRHVLDAGGDINSRAPIFPGSAKLSPPPLIAAIQARSRARALAELVSEKPPAPVLEVLAQQPGIEEHDALIRFLVENGVDLDARATDNSLETAFSCATFHGDVDIIRLLMDHGAHVTEKDRDRSLVLFNAVQHNDLDLLRLLLEHGFNVDACEHTETTALHRAVLSGHDAVVQFLTANGAAVNARDAMMETPIFRTISGRRESWYPVRKKILQSLVEAGADFDAKNWQGRPVLFKALPSVEMESITSDMVELGADPNVRDDNGCNLLHVAAVSRELYPKVEYLGRKLGVDVNAKNGTGRTPLHEVLYSPSLRAALKRDVVSALLKLGADIHSIDDAGRSPVDLARSNRSKGLEPFTNLILDQIDRRSARLRDKQE